MVQQFDCRGPVSWSDEVLGAKQNEFIMLQPRQQVLLVCVQIDGRYFASNMLDRQITTEPVLIGDTVVPIDLIRNSEFVQHSSCVLLCFGKKKWLSEPGATHISYKANMPIEFSYLLNCTSMQRLFYRLYGTIVCAIRSNKRIESEVLCKVYFKTHYFIFLDAISLKRGKKSACIEIFAERSSPKRLSVRKEISGEKRPGPDCVVLYSRIDLVNIRIFS